MALPFTTAFPGPNNVYIPAFQGKMQAQLIVSYARDPKRFAVNKLAQRAPTNTLAGNWLTLRPEVLARILNDPNEVVWVDGQPRPTGTHNQQDFRATTYQCVRRARPAYIGWQTRDQAVWDIVDTQQQVLAHQMMTQRAFAFYNVAMASGNHLASHVKTATAWSSIGGYTGGFWSAGTSTNPIVQRTLLQVGVEDGQIYRAISAPLKREMARQRVYPSLQLLKPITDKQARARTLQGRMQQGMVSFSDKAEWYDQMRTEMLRFPSGVHDDQVDSAAWNAIMVAGRQPPRKQLARPMKSWKDRLVGAGDGTHMAA